MDAKHTVSVVAKEKTPDPRDLESEHAEKTSRLLKEGQNQVPSTTFPPILQSEPTSPDRLDEPALCKSVVYVPAADELQEVGPTRRKITQKLAQEKLQPLPFTNPDYCDKIVSSVWEEANDAQEHEMSRSQKWKAKNENAEDRSGHRLPCLFPVAQIKERFLQYGREWTSGLHWKVAEASHRVFCTNVVWCLVLGTWLEQKTAGKLGLVEIFVASAVCGGLFDLLGGQAILVVGVSAPSLVFVVAISTSGERLGVDIVPWMGWIGLWSSVVLMLLSMSNASRLTNHMTFFSWDVVQVFIGLSFLWGGFEQIAHFFSSTVALDSALLSLWLATSAFFVATSLGNARHWRVFDRQTCDAIADYGPVLAMLLFTAVPHLPKLSQPQLLQVSLPKAGYHTDQVSKLGFIRLKILPFWAILLAVIPGIMLAGMIFIYQNAASILIQEKTGSNLHARSSKRWDLWILAWLTLLCSLFGFPFTCGQLFQSSVHVRALTFKLQDHSDLENQQRLLSKVAVQRVSGIAASILSGLPLLPGVRRLVGKIPQAVLAGLFLQMACQILRSWNTIAFISTFFNKPPRKSTFQSRFSFPGVSLYSFIQISCILVVLIVSKTPAAVLFPLFIFATFCLRHFVLRGLFKRESFSNIDPELMKEYSDISSTEPSLESPEVTQVPQEAWPQQVMLQTLKAAASVPTTRAAVRMEADSSESPLRHISPSLLITSSRRLKERSRRRHKRKRQTSFEITEEVEHTDSELQSDSPIPPLVEAMMQSASQDYTSVTKELPSRHEEDTSINLSKRVSPRLSPQFFKRSKQKTGGEVPLEVHSNLLYDPRWRTKRTKPPELQEDIKGLAEESRGDSNMVPVQQQMEQNQQSDASTALGPGRDKSCPGIVALDLRTSSQNAEASTDIIIRHSEAYFPSKAGVDDAEHEKQEIVFQGSPGIGRCVRSPSFKPSNESRKRRPLQFSLSMPRRKAPLKEDIYPPPVPASAERNENIEPGGSSLLTQSQTLHSHLLKSRTSRWPTTTSFMQKVQEHLSQQRHAASQSREGIKYTV